MFELDYQSEWDVYFKKFDKGTQEKIWKKIQHIKMLKGARHLKHGLKYYVVESGQYRICFEELGAIRRIMFAGNHKQYEKWIQKQ